MTPIPNVFSHQRDAGDNQAGAAATTPGDDTLDASERGAAARLTVLLVEDDSSLTDPWSDSLRFAGYECLVARDVAAALAVLADEAQRIAIMVADLNLAGNDGAALARTARNLPRYSALPVIITSGDETQAAYERARLAGMNAYLVKPVTTQALLGAIARWTRAKP